MSSHNQHHKTPAMGFGQLTLVEHSLCPLDRSASLVQNLVHQSEYRYSDDKRKRHTACAKIISPLGLSASDELYLWGLLALTLSQSGDRSDLIATPHWCLKQLGIVNTRSGRGGEQYRQFRDALKRLSTTTYLCDAFYDPGLGEHRDVSFHFFSYSLPCEDSSTRAWRIHWDQTFINLAKHGASHLRFDLELYRSLDPASRRLFLFVSKIFHRRATLPQFELRSLAVDVLGFSSAIALRDLRMKVLRCLKRLDSKGVVCSGQVLRVAKGHYIVNACRGKHFERTDVPEFNTQNSQPVLETLVGLGFEVGAASRLTRKYPIRLLEEWADITQAAMERHGRKFFRKSPMAYFVDSVSKAHLGQRTPPDWWHEVRREEQNQAALSVQSKEVFHQIRSELFSDSTSTPSEKASQRIKTTADILKSVI